MKNRKKLISLMAGILAAVMLLSLIAGLIPTYASAASSSEIKKQINELKEQQGDLKDQMEEVQSQYEENEDEITNMVNQKNVIDQEIALLHEQIDNINAQISAYALLIADKQEELDEAQEHLEELNRKNRERIRSMEEDGKISYWSVLFKANSFADLLDRLEIIEEIAAADQRRLEEMSQAADQVEIARDELAGEKDELETTKDELNAAQVALDEKRAEADALLAELVERGYQLEDLYAQYEQEEKDVLAEIAQKEQEYNEAKRQEWLAYMATYTTVPPATQATTAPTTGNSGSSGTTGGNTDATEPTENAGGSSNTDSGATNSGNTVTNEKWLVPCSYTLLSSPFGKREAPTAGASTYHEGVDLAGPEGTPIYASRTGVVTAATYGKAAGYYVSINHGDGFSSIYMHMTRYVVKKGQAVSAGQLIGYMGSTGISTGPHLHFGIAKNGTYVNPAYYVNLHP